MQELTKDVATRLKLNVQQGVIVTDVADNSIAAAQDIQREDVITEVDGKMVTNVVTFAKHSTNRIRVAAFCSISIAKEARPSQF